jgi:cation diffusion facilitator family transporter
LALVLVAQYAIYRAAGSIALLTDIGHHLGDVLTAPVVAAAVCACSAVWEGRARKLIALVVFVSAVYAGYQAIMRFVEPSDRRQVGAVAAAGAIAMISNFAAAEIRARVGARICSPALIADGEHARADTLLSIGVMLSAAATHFGAPILDPVIGLAFAVLIAHIALRTWITAAHTTTTFAQRHPRVWLIGFLPPAWILGWLFFGVTFWAWGGLSAGAFWDWLLWPRSLHHETALARAS